MGRGPISLRVAPTLLERNANACILARVPAVYLPRSRRDSRKRQPHTSVPAEIGLHEPCQSKNLASGRVNQPKLRNLPGLFVLGNAPLLAISRTIAVRFFQDGRAHKVASARVFKKTAQKNTVFAKNIICFSSLNSHSQFFIEFPSKITKRGTFNAGIFEQLMDTFPHPRRIRNRQRQFNESHHAKYTFS